MQRYENTANGSQSNDNVLTKSGAKASKKDKLRPSMKTGKQSKAHASEQSMFDEIQNAMQSIMKLKQIHTLVSFEASAEWVTTVRTKRESDTLRPKFLLTWERKNETVSVASRANNNFPKGTV